MNEVDVKHALKSLIIDNHATLVQDLIHQGQQRYIAQVALTNLTPPSGYYYILVYIPEVRRYSQTNGVTVRRPKGTAEYDIQLEISDEALLQLGDDEAYETMALDFDKFTDRIVDLIETQNFISFEDARLKIKRATGETDRRVEKSNLSGPWTDTENNGVALLYAQIRFTLVDECVDTSRLYS